MEWYYGNSMDEFVVPKEGEVQDRLPSSPDSWFKWGTSDNELNFNGKRSSTYDVDMGAPNHSKDRYRAFSNSLQQDYQLDDFPGIDQMDNIFMTSLLGELPLTDSFHKSVSVSHSSQNPAESFLTQSQNNWSDTESSKYARTGDVLDSEHKEHQPVEIEDYSHCEEKNTSGCMGEEAETETETSIEEYVLQDLEIVMTQMTEKTRICFRDALYRLAKSSKQHMEEGGDVSMEEAPPWTPALNDETTTTTEAMESETNTIDRAVANLMYSEMESNVGNVLLTAPAAELEEQAYEA